MKKYIFIVAIISLLTLTSAVYSLDFDDTQISGLNVTTDIEGAFNASQSENKTLAIIFDQDSCVYCDILKENVLSDGDVQKVLNENFIVLMVDINKNPDIAQKYNVYGTPTIQFLDSNGNAVDKIDGCPEKVDFLKVIKEI
ncbi:thioredoxin family protein [Methanobrevibacter sp.]|uniref:thioredoxin family protein n=1 Tax=Methanobrevibacter sp. TaxID=66852 RepID=UPI00388F4710